MIVVGRIRLCVERDFGIFLFDDDWVGSGTFRVWEEEIASEAFVDDDGRGRGIGKGGVEDDVEFSRSLFMELDVWAA